MRRHVNSPLVLVFLLASAGPVWAIHPKPILIFGSPGTGDGQFSIPVGLALDDSSNVYVTDVNLHRVQKFDSTGAYMAQWGSFGSGAGEFDQPTGIAIDPSGNFYVCDLERVQKFTRNGMYLLEWQAQTPSGVDVLPNGNIVTHQQSGGSLRFTNSSGGFLFDVSNPSPGMLGNIENELFLHVGPGGAIYRSDFTQHKVVQTTDFGIPVREWGMQGSLAGEFNSPEGMASDANGNLLVAELSNSRVQVFDSTGVYLGVFGSAGTDSGRFIAPTGIDISASGRIFVVDNGISRVQVFETMNHPPVVATHLPAPGDTLKPGEMVAITWTARDDFGDASLTVDLSYTADLRLFGSTASGSDVASSLYEIDVQTGGASLVGAIGFDHVNGLAAHLFSGVLYGAGERAVGNTPVLIRIDPDAGAGVEDCPLDANLPGLSDLSFDPVSGELLDSEGSALFEVTPSSRRIDLLTGNQEFLASASTAGLGGAFAYSPTGQGYLALTLSGTTNVFKYNPLLGSYAGTTVLTIPGGYTNVYLAAMDFDPLGGGLYGVLKASEGTYLAHINVGSGQVDVRPMALPDNLKAIAFAPSNRVSIANDELNDGTYDWEVPASVGHAVRVCVEAADEEGARGSDMTDGYFSIINVVGVPNSHTQSGTYLAPAAPNPFTHKSTLRFSLARAGHVELAVHDARGRWIRNLLSGTQPAGSSVVDWDGKNNAGQEVPPGVYLVRLRTEEGLFSAMIQRVR